MIHPSAIAEREACAQELEEHARDLLQAGQVQRCEGRLPEAKTYEIQAALYAEAADRIRGGSGTGHRRIRAVRFAVPGPPPSLPRARSRPQGGKPRRDDEQLPRMRRVEAAFIQAVAQQGGNLGAWRSWRGPVRLTLEARRKCPQNDPRDPRFTEWRKENPDLARPDVDNVVKLAGDALNGLAFEDDSQVCELWARKRRASYGEAPCTIIGIEHFEEDPSKGEGAR